MTAIRGYLNYYDTLAHEFVANYDRMVAYGWAMFTHLCHLCLHVMCWKRSAPLQVITLTGSFLEVEDFNWLIIDNARSMAFEFTDPDSGDVPGHEKHH